MIPTDAPATATDAIANMFEDDSFLMDGVELPADEVEEVVVEEPVIEEPVVIDEPVADEPVVEVPETPETPAVETKPAITTFKVFDAEGNEVAAPTVVVGYKANGKELREPLDKVVRRAQYGAYNETLLQERDTLKGKTGELESGIAEREQLIALREQQIERMLTDEDFLDKARSAFESFNDPEARATRAEKALADRSVSERQQRESEQVLTQVSERILPVYEALTKNHNTITEDEVRGRFDRLTQAWRVNGTIPANRLPEVERLLVDDFGPWAAQLHEHRLATTRSASEEAKATVAKAQEDAAAAKRTLARATSPGKSGGTARSVAAKTISTADDALDDIAAMLDAM